MSAFSVVAMICIGGMQPQECAPAPGFSRDVVIVATADNEIECSRRGMFDPAKSSTFRSLDDGEFVKIMCMRSGKATAAVEAMKMLKINACITEEMKAAKIQSDTDSVKMAHDCVQKYKTYGHEENSD